MLRSTLAFFTFVSTMLAASSVHEFGMTSIDGRPMPLSAYKGKVLLLVNVASKCGYTPQYAGLEALHRQYKDQGLVVLGVPANNFGGQEPGTNEEIQSFCKRTYDVTFPLTSKVSVKGEDIAPLYRHLTSASRGRREVEFHEVSCWKERRGTGKVRVASEAGRA